MFINQSVWFILEIIEILFNYCWKHVYPHFYFKSLELLLNIHRVEVTNHHISGRVFQKCIKLSSKMATIFTLNFNVNVVMIIGFVFQCDSEYIISIKYFLIFINNFFLNFFFDKNFLFWLDIRYFLVLFLFIVWLSNRLNHLCIVFFILPNYILITGV